MYPGARGNTHIHTPCMSNGMSHVEYSLPCQKLYLHLSSRQICLHDSLATCRIARLCSRSTRNCHASCTVLTCSTTPPSIVEQKAEQLQQIGPAGYSRLLVYALVCLPLWLMTAMGLVVKYARRWAEPQAVARGTSSSGKQLTGVPCGSYRNSPLSMFSRTSTCS